MQNSTPNHWPFHGMAFSLEQVSRPPWRKTRQRISFEIARERMVANLRAELIQFVRERRNTRHRTGIEAAPLGRLLVSRVVAGDDRARALIRIG